MKPIEPAHAARPATRAETRIAPRADTSPSAAAAAPRTDEFSAIDIARYAGTSAPIQQERVTEIRKAIEQGTYPIVPATIADAMIAASFLLRQGK